MDEVVLYSPPMDRSTLVTSRELLEESFDAGFGIWLTARAVGALVDECSSAHGWSADEFAVITMIAARGETTNAELARWLAASRTTVSSLLARLERAGDIGRRPHAQDGRSMLVFLEPAGQTKLANVRAELGPYLTDLGERLDHVGMTVEMLIRARIAVDQERLAMQQAGATRKCVSKLGARERTTRHP